MKPPPGMLWPRRRMKTPTVSASGSSDAGDHDQHQRMAVAGLAPVRQAAEPAARRRRRSGAVEQREDRQCGDAQDDDLAERVVAAEVDQDHVDDVGAAAAGLGIGEVLGGDGLGEVAGQHGVERGADGEPAGGGDGEVAPAAQPRAARAGVFCGRKFRASSIRMVVTTSTESWVSARSGAEK